MKNVVFRKMRDPIDAFQVDREIQEIKKLLSNLPLIWGNGSPSGIVQAKTGTLFLNLDGGANTTLYVKESGSDSSGWVAK